MCFKKSRIFLIKSASAAGREILRSLSLEEQKKIKKEENSHPESLKRGAKGAPPEAQRAGRSA